MEFIGIIPARYASTRFPGKPLVEIKGISMIQRVYEQCKKANIFDEIIVATDDKRILDHVLDFGGLAQMTSADHKSGTDRCAEVVNGLNTGDNTVVLNIQGDEPYIKPEQIRLLTNAFHDPAVKIATLTKKVDDNNKIFNPNIVKLTFDNQYFALCFSRSPLPYLRNTDEKEWLQNETFFYHIGIYAFRASVLKELVKLEQSRLEKAESLEQLRWMENGYKIKVIETDLGSHGIDTPSDLENLLTIA